MFASYCSNYFVNLLQMASPPKLTQALSYILPPQSSSNEL